MASPLTDRINRSITNTNMKKFNFYNPTTILFGRGKIAEISSRLPKGKTVLFLYGGGSIKKNGIYGQVCRALKGVKFVEFSGIEANPLYETCLKAAALAKKNKVGFILAVGGGSVLDAAKFISAAVLFKGKSAWDILRQGGSNVREALPIGTVLTLPATGSEANGNSVISRKETHEKLPFYSKLVYPKFSVLDPEATFSLPQNQLRNGIVDSFVHVMEQYATYPAEAPLQDRFSEGIIQTLIEVAPKILKNPKDYNSQSSFMWSATLALNTLIACGVPQDWSTHMIGHELTAFYGLAHAETLAIILPGVWKYKLKSKREKLRQFGKRIWNVKTAEQAIEKTEAFFHSIKMPTRLSNYKIDAREASEKISKRFKERGAAFGENGDIKPADVAKIILSRK